MARFQAELSRLAVRFPGYGVLQYYKILAYTMAEEPERGVIELANKIMEKTEEQFRQYLRYIDDAIARYV